MKKGFVKLLILAIVFVLATLILAAFTIKPYRISDESMKPTLKNGQKIFVNKFSYSKGLPKRGDIVIMGTSNKAFIRRVLGLPGENIEIRKGRVYVNAQLLDEPYLINAYENDFDQKTIKLDTHYLVLADNRNTAYYQGTKLSIFALVPKNNIVGKYLLSY